MASKGLVDRADEAARKYVRKRDSCNGMAKCVSCGKILRVTEMEVGHYISRINKSVRWDEMNISLQCHTCNVNLCGNVKEYRKTLVEKHGEEAVKLLERRGRLCVKFSDNDLRKIIQYYNNL